MITIGTIVLNEFVNAGGQISGKRIVILCTSQNLVISTVNKATIIAVNNPCAPKYVQFINNELFHPLKLNNLLVLQLIEKQQVQLNQLVIPFH